MFLMRQICCSNWPPRNYFVTTCFPHFFLLKLPYPKSNCVYINTLNPTHCLHMAMYIDGRNFYCSPELNNGMLLELPILTAFHFNWNGTGIIDNCGFRVTYDGGQISLDCTEPVFFSFYYSDKNVTKVAELFSPSSYILCRWILSEVEFVMVKCISKGEWIKWNEITIRISDREKKKFWKYSYSGYQRMVFWDMSNIWVPTFQRNLQLPSPIMKKEAADTSRR